MTLSQDHLVLLPILIPLAGAMLALLLRKWRRFQAGWSLAVMTVSLACSLWLFAEVWISGQPRVFFSGGWPVPFGIALVADSLSIVFVVMAQLIMTMGVLYALSSRDSVVRYPTFYPIFLMLGVGLTGAFLTGDLFNMYVFAELMLISGVALTALSDHRFGVEAAFKYFYLSLLASFFMLLSIGALYISYGTLNMADLSARIQANPDQPMLLPALALLLATFMIKSAVFPFHFWQPDLYMTAPTPVGAVLSSVVGKVGLYGFLRMTTLIFVPQSMTIQGILLILGIIGIIFGGLSAIGTKNLKRMLAYSSMSQIGFMLVGIGWGTPFALAATIVFAFNHSLIKASLMMLAGYVASRTPGKSAEFDALTGAGKSLPLAGFLFFVGSLALAGIPPTNGFISKMLLFSSGIGSARFWSLLIIGLASILTLIYTMRAFRKIWWQQPEDDTLTPVPGDGLIAPALLTILLLVFGIWAAPVVSVAQQTTDWLADPANYILAVLGG